MTNPLISSSEIAGSLKESLNYIKAIIGSFRPDIGIILGTGLGGLVKDVDIYFRIEYNDIPNFPVSTVESHHGFLIFGNLCGHKVIIMQGRFHYYEGYDMQTITYPLNIFNYLGIKYLIVSNACGTINHKIHKGDIMIMKDHINFHFDSPIKGHFINIANTSVYDSSLLELAAETALENDIVVKRGVYCTLQGPNLETKSEYRAMMKLGADVVGMSTVPEAVFSKQLGIKVIGFSIVTDEGYPDTLKPASLNEILNVAAEAEPRLTILIKKIIEKL